MRLTLFILSVLLVRLPFAANSPWTIKVMTYNINAETHGDGSYSDIAEVINEINPDIAGFQKIDSCNSRNDEYVLGWLGNETGRLPSFAPAIKNYNNSKGAYGVGFLTKEPPLSERRLWLEHTASEQDRGALELTISLNTVPVRIIVTHLAHEGASYRKTQIQKILEWIDSAGNDSPVIIMADFNAAYTESSMQLLENAGFIFVKGQDGAILDTTNNNINHILYRPDIAWELNDAGNPHYDASNRNPVWAEFTLLPTAVIRSTWKSRPVITPQSNYIPGSFTVQLFDLAGREYSSGSYNSLNNHIQSTANQQVPNQSILLIHSSTRTHTVKNEKLLFLR